MRSASLSVMTQAESPTVAPLTFCFTAAASIFKLLAANGRYRNSYSPAFEHMAEFMDDLPIS